MKMPGAETIELDAFLDLVRRVGHQQLQDLIARRDNPALDLFSPRRFTPIKSAKTWATENATVIKHLVGDRLSAARTFKVESKRADKAFPLTSIQLSQWVGGELDERYPDLRVDVHHPELTIHLEVRDYAAYVHADPEPGAGGRLRAGNRRSPRAPRGSGNRAGAIGTENGKKVDCD